MQASWRYYKGTTAPPCSPPEASICTTLCIQSDDYCRLVLDWHVALCLLFLLVLVPYDYRREDLVVSHCRKKHQYRFIITIITIITIIITTIITSIDSWSASSAS